jgi:uncharacterized DUF497 family protein
MFAPVFADINNRYVVGYYSANKEHDGKRRNVKIEVRGHPEYIVWGRKTTSRMLYVIFAERHMNVIRIVSARPPTPTERELYEGQERHEI